MPPKNSRRPPKRAALLPMSPSSSSTSSSSSSSSSSSDEQEEVVALITSKNSSKDSASENRDWDQSSLDQERSRGGSPAASNLESPPPASPIPPSAVQGSTTTALGPVGSDEKHSPAFGPVGNDAKNSRTFVPVGSDAKSSGASAPVNSTATRPSASLKPITMGESTLEDDECFVVDEDGTRVTTVERTGQNSPVVSHNKNSPVTPLATTPQTRAKSEGESGLLLHAIKSTSPSSSARKSTPPNSYTARAGDIASFNASANTSGNASGNASSRASGDASGNASDNASIHASSDASGNSKAGDLKAAGAQSGKGSPTPASCNAKESGNASACTSSKQNADSPAFEVLPDYCINECSAALPIPVHD